MQQWRNSLSRPLGGCPRTTVRLRKIWVRSFSALFKLNSKTIRLKKPRKLPRTSFPSARPLFSDNHLVYLALLLASGCLTAADTTDRGIFIDDGDYDQSGHCLGSVMIFAGGAMDCRLPGVSSAWQDCCAKDDGEIYLDSMGSIIDTYSYMQGLTTAAEAAAIAYNAYSAGASSAEAAGAASDFMANSFDPTTMAVTIAITLIMNYLEKACPPEDIETAIMNSSGFCVELGTKCTKEWLGECVQQVEVKCCFSSKLARIIHEQGRPQLGLTFGTVDEPNCAGFSAEQFQSLDFSTINLAEYYDELRHKKQNTIEQDLNQTMTSKLQGP
jgi:conjugal transfer mating pair stabilization protein TraN